MGSGTARRAALRCPRLGRGLGLDLDLNLDLGLGLNAGLAVTR